MSEIVAIFSGTRCIDCGKVDGYHRVGCSSCHSLNIEWGVILENGFMTTESLDSHVHQGGVARWIDGEEIKIEELET